MYGSGVNSVDIDMEFECKDCESCADENLPPCGEVWTDSIWTDDSGSVDGAETECPKCKHKLTISERD